MKMKGKNIIIKSLLVFLLVFLPAVFAQEQEFADEFVIIGENDIPVYQCAPASTHLVIQNNGQVVQQYFFEQTGKAAEWALIQENSVLLNPGEKKTITVNFAIPCNAKGTKTLATKVVSLSGEQRTLKQNIIIYKPENLKLEIPFEKEIKPCSLNEMQLTLANPVNFTEQYVLSSVSNLKTIFSENDISLQPGEKKEVTLTVDTSECQLLHTPNLKLLIKTKESDVEFSKEVALVLDKEGTPELSVNELFTDGSTKEFTGKIRNLGKEKVNFALKVKDLDWVKFEPAEFTLNELESGEFKIILTPTQEIQSGQQKFLLEIYSDLIDKAFREEITIFVKKPGFVKVFLQTYKKHMIFGVAGVVALFVLIYLSSLYFKSNFYKKRKAQKEKIRAEIQEAKRKEEELKQKLREEKNIQKIKQEVEFELRKKYKFVNKELKEKSVNKFSKFILTIFVLGILIGIGATVYHFRDVISVQYVLKSLNYFTEEKNFVTQLMAGILGVVFLLILSICIKRTKKIKHVLNNISENEEIKVNFWKKGITAVSFKSLKSFNGGFISIKKQKVKEILPGKVYKAFALDINVPVENVTLHVRIPEKFFENNDAEEMLFIKEDKNSRDEVPIKETASDKKYRYYELVVSPQCKKVIFYGKVKRAKEKNTTIKYVFLFFLLAIFVVLITFVSKPSAEKTLGIPDQVWNQDERRYLNLSQYFTDPDGDKLNFKSSPTENIVVDVINDVALLIPKEGWTGQELVTFYAEDESGELAKSNIVRLKVQKRIMPKQLEPYKNVIGIAGVILVLLIFLVYFKQSFVSKL